MGIILFASEARETKVSFCFRANEAIKDMKPFDLPKGVGVSIHWGSHIRSVLRSEYSLSYKMCYRNGCERFILCFSTESQGNPGSSPRPCPLLLERDSTLRIRSFSSFSVIGSSL
jgi:hypothetical protein